MEYSYLHQIVKKLTELERYCIDQAGMRFDATLLTKTTPESPGTLARYEKEHTITLKPFIKWVGGKGQLIDELEKMLPSDGEKVLTK